MNAWSWCRNGHHRDCRGRQPDGCGGYDACGCACHNGDAFDREMEGRIERERDYDRYGRD